MVSVIFRKDAICLQYKTKIFLPYRFVCQDSVSEWKSVVKTDIVLLLKEVS